MLGTKDAWILVWPANEEEFGTSHAGSESPASVAGIVNLRASPLTLMPNMLSSRRAALGISEMRASTARLLFENGVLLPQVCDHLKLVTIRPPGEGHEKEPPSDRLKHPPSLLVAAAAGWLG